MTDLERALLHIKTRADAWAVREIKKALEQEPCDNAVSREAVLKIIDGWYDNNREVENIEDLIILITYMQAVQPKRQGHREYNDIYDHYLCSKCKTIVADYDNFCPNCGARMVEPQESEEQTE